MLQKVFLVKTKGVEMNIYVLIFPSTCLTHFPVRKEGLVVCVHVCICVCVCVGGSSQSQPCWSHWDRLASCLSFCRNWFLTQQFPGLIKSKQYECGLFLFKTPQKAFTGAPDILAVETC